MIFATEYSSPRTTSNMPRLPYPFSISFRFFLASSSISLGSWVTCPWTMSPLLTLSVSAAGSVYNVEAPFAVLLDCSPSAITLKSVVNGLEGSCLSSSWGGAWLAVDKAGKSCSLLTSSTLWQGCMWCGTGWYVPLPKGLLRPNICWKLQTGDGPTWDDASLVETLLLLLLWLS